MAKKESKAVSKVQKPHKVAHGKYTAFYIAKGGVRFMVGKKLTKKSDIPHKALAVLEKKLKSEAEPPMLEKDKSTGQITKGVAQDTNKNGTAGAPSLMDDPKIQADLLVAAALGANNEACCAYAKVSTSTFYSYITDHPEFSEQMEQKKNEPYLAALQSVVRSMQEDPKLALKFLERRHKDEFSLRREMTGADGAKLFEGMSDEEIRRFITSGND